MQGSKAKGKASPQNLVLIPDPKQSTVPTHSARVLLESKGYVLYCFPFDRDWDGIELPFLFRAVFPQIQSLQLGYEYLKVCINNI